MPDVYKTLLGPLGEYKYVVQIGQDELPCVGLNDPFVIHLDIAGVSVILYGSTVNLKSPIGLFNPVFSKPVP